MYIQVCAILCMCTVVIRSSYTNLFVYIFPKYTKSLFSISHLHIYRKRIYIYAYMYIYYTNDYFYLSPSHMFFVYDHQHPYLIKFLRGPGGYYRKLIVQSLVFTYFKRQCMNNEYKILTLHLQLRPLLNKCPTTYHVNHIFIQ